MKRVLITGAGGFIGRALLDVLTAQLSVHELLLVDRDCSALASSGRVIEGDLSDPAVLAAVLDARPEVVFHLASVPGRSAEQDYALGRRVNVDATLDLFAGLAEKTRPPQVVYASSVAVYGELGADPVNDHTPAQPQLSYGTHKRMMELALADFSRRGELRGVALRLPGVVARPESAGFGSAFMSGLIRSLAAGEPYICPVSPDARAWWLSARCAAQNLRHAADLETSGTWLLPALHLSVRQVVDAVREVSGQDVQALVKYRPDGPTETVFGRFPPLHTEAAEALGFRHDGTAAALIRAALGQPGGADG